MSCLDRLSLKEKGKGWNNYCQQPYQLKTAKSRLSKENKDVTVRLYYDERGLDRYYGLLQLKEIMTLENVNGRYEMNGRKSMERIS